MELVYFVKRLRPMYVNTIVQTGTALDCNVNYMSIIPTGTFGKL